MRLSINPNLLRTRCSRSEATFDITPPRPLGLCGCCPGEPLMLEYDYSDISRQPGVLPFVATLDPGPWRYAPLLPVHGASEAYAYDVGQTVTLPCGVLGAEAEVDLFLKSDATNPSRRAADRGLAVAIAFGVAVGVKCFALPGDGPELIGAAMFAARAGVAPAVLYMPRAARGGRIEAEARHFGATVRFHGADVAGAADRLASDLARSIAAGETVNLAAFAEPARLEGAKTLMLEIVEAFGAADLPKWIVWPPGSGMLAVGAWKALRELSALGYLTSRHTLPRLVIADGLPGAALAQAFDAGADPATVRVAGMRMGHRVVRALRESGGRAVPVGAEAVAAAHAAMGRHGVRGGVGAAAAWAAVQRLRAERVVAPGERVLVVFPDG